jgi:hypothetical protein
VIGVDLLTPMWAYWLGLGDGVPAVWTDRGLPAARSLAVTDLDAELIQLAFEVIAAESACDRCGAPLGRGVHLEPPSGECPPSAVAAILTRCRGWRRHRHLAMVCERSNHLLLGPFAGPGPTSELGPLA